MSEEICKNCKYHYMEEISFDYPQSCCNKTNPNHTTEEWFHCDCFEYSKNYITNLQEELENKAYEQLKTQCFVYKERIDKAIEYIENEKNKQNSVGVYTKDIHKNLLKILKGDE